MTELEKVLQECLHDLEQGASNVDECLGRHPKHAQQLEPILLMGAYLERARAARVSDAFKARVRTKLIQQMYAHPRTSRLKMVAARPGFMFARLAASLAAIVLALLATGIVHAQSALPGEAFYGWKLASENAWRAVSFNPVGTDLAIAERRVDELIAIRDDPALYSQTLEGYLEVASRLRSAVDVENEARILAVLDSQAEELNRSGIVLPRPGQNVPPQSNERTPAPATIPLPTATPLPILETPQVDSTDLPQIAPTIQAPSEPAIEVPPVVVPPIQDPPEIIPTIEIPPLIP